jgi:choline dehydrogenase-like flavoprotein
LASTWRYENGEEFQPQIHYCVGGPTKLYGAALYPLRKEDFGELRHHDGVSPAWPIAYDELEPYYTLAEQLYCVHGARGEDPTEPDRALGHLPPGRGPDRRKDLAPAGTAQIRRTHHRGRRRRRAGDVGRGPLTDL